MNNTTDAVAIRVRELGKCYQIYDQPQDRLKQSLFPRLLRVLGKHGTDYFREFWALRDVSFDIDHGETVGIIGRNGSGKSTLLQIICGTLTPSHGEVEVEGRIAALLELGAGFNPEFTGRENVYLNASVLGLSRDEIDQRFDAIAEFADIGQFIEQPTKTYSSGMVVRLGFAVAINVDPEILIVDEALAVGDERFQRKCYSRIEDIKAQGATVLFVSHSGATVIDLCDRAILLDDGMLLAEGIPKALVGRYQRLLYSAPEQRKHIREGILAEAEVLLARAEHKPEQMEQEESVSYEEQGCKGSDARYSDEARAESYDPALVPTSTVAHESQGAELKDIVLVTEAGEPVNNILRGRSYKLRYTVQFTTDARTVRFGMIITNSAGALLGGGISASSAAKAVQFVPAGTEYFVSFRFTCRLNPGVYFFNSGVLGAVAGGTETYLHRLVDAGMFRVLPEPDDTATGPVDFNCVAHFTRVDHAR